MKPMLGRKISENEVFEASKKSIAPKRSQVVSHPGTNWNQCC